MEHFTVSDAWLRNLKSRNAMTGRTLCAEEKEVDKNSEDVTTHKENLSEIWRCIAPG